MGILYDTLPIDSNNVAFAGISEAVNVMTPSNARAMNQAKDGAMARFLADNGGTSTIGGTANALTVTLSQPFTAYGSAAGQIPNGARIAIKPVSANTGAVTININAIGTSAIRLEGDAALVGGEMLANGVYLLRYDTAYNSGAGGWVLLNAATANGGQLAGFRNSVINGNFQVWQRASSFSISSTASTYTADRWALTQGTGTVAITVARQSAPAAGVQYSSRVQRNSANTNINNLSYTQIIETANCIPLQGRTVTLSFYAKCGANYSAASSAFGSNIATGTGADQGLAGALAGSWTGFANAAKSNTLTTSRQLFTQTVTIPSGATEIAVSFGMTPVGTAGTNDWFEIDSIQLEIGYAATAAEQRSIGIETYLCKRYAGWLTYGVARVNAATDVTLNATHPALMRASPSYTLVNGTGAIVEPTISALTISSIGSTFSAAPESVIVELVVSSGTTGTTGFLLSGNVIYASAEL